MRHRFAGGEGRGAARQTGLTKVYGLEGGMRAWQRAGHPVEGHQDGWPVERPARLLVGVLTVAGAALALVLHPTRAMLSVVMGVGMILAAGAPAPEQ